MARSDDIREDIKRRLEATGQFAGVFTSGLPEEQGFSAGDLCAAVIGMPARRKAPRWDGGSELKFTVDERVTVTLLVRNTDPVLRDRQADLLTSVLEDAVDGQSLAEITVPGHTYAEASRPLNPRAPERRVEVVVYYQYLRLSPGGADETP